MMGKFAKMTSPTVMNKRALTSRDSTGDAKCSWHGEGTKWARNKSSLISLTHTAKD